MTLGTKLLMAGQTIASEQTQPPQAAESSSTCRRLLRSLAWPAALLLFGVAMEANAAQAKSDGAVGQLKLDNGTGATASGQQGGGAQGDVITLNAEGIPPWEFSTDPGENWRFFPPAWQTVPLSAADLTDFELSATLTIGAYEFKTPPYAARARTCLRGNLSLFTPDGRASCAHVYPRTVNGQRAACNDPLANDQDWALIHWIWVEEILANERTKN